MIYNGQLDMILGPPLTEDFLRTLEWGGTEEYRHAKKTIWKFGGEVVGYARSVRKLRQVVVRSAGHLLPADQPDVALDMITRFVENRHF
jgi:vitellogenic carboxypeptidase-like protein